VRACLDDPETLALARAFGVPVLLNANVRDGSLRQAVLERNVPMLVYEGGEALRFDEQAIRAGVRGVFSVMHHLGMVAFGAPGRRQEPVVANSSHWVRAPEAGILRARANLGVPVAAGDVLGVIADPLGTEEAEVRAAHAGVVIARTELPLVNEGDAIFHLATFHRPERVAESVDDFQEALDQLEP
jgi:predicted deacylase